jgi:4-hydroxybenzoate polyprenyltransferase
MEAESTGLESGPPTIRIWNIDFSPYHKRAHVVGGYFPPRLRCRALNQYQEREFDARMERTKGRPIPSGGIAPGRALRFAVFFMSLGLGVLAVGSGLWGTML